jgi:hypothetical protein
LTVNHVPTIRRHRMSGIEAAMSLLNTPPDSLAEIRAVW